MNQDKKSFSIIGSTKTKSSVERVMMMIFVACGLTAVLAVVAITAYMLISGVPAVGKVGLFHFLFDTSWHPTAKNPQFGILSMILTSIVGTFGAILVGVPIGLLTAIFLAEIAPKKLGNAVRPAVELLAGIPSVIYGLVGMIVIVPFIGRMEIQLFGTDPAHTFTGGANLFSGILVLAIMILPTVINVSETSLRAVPNEYKEASLALGATPVTTIFKIMIPAARSGIATSIVLGIGRAIGEAMAIIMVSGNAVNLPNLWNSVRFLTTGIVSEMSYASGLHRQVLFSIGLILFIFIFIINIVLNAILKKGGEKND
ncbi:MAG: pstC [Oscillospiraceae bacterium]|nr:pstC [Oscillospiraceae bacterium]